ncbi:hypothetical protein P7L75_09380 [Tistrella mobilis]|uniref:terminase large subunit domain-containing protein n=1 Tax=Tistrella mobilis TaxID=171437 RepID=UPI003556D9B3
MSSAPDLLLGYQRRLLVTVSQYALIACEKSRRIGVTWALAFLAVMTAAAAPEAGGSKVFYMGTSLEMAREFVAACADWAAAVNEIAGETEGFVFEDRLPSGETRSMQGLRIKFASGFAIEALPSTPRAFRGRQGLVILDEAAFHDDLEEVLKAALALTMWGGRVIVISTHDGAGNPFNLLVEDIRAGKVAGAEVVRITFDDAVMDGLYERVALTGRHGGLTKEQWIAQIRGIYRDNAGEELDVIPRSGGGAYLPMSLIRSRMQAGVPLVRYTAPAGMVDWSEEDRRAEVARFVECELRSPIARLSRAARQSIGVDFGRLGDLSVVHLVETARDMTRTTGLVLEMRDVPFEVQRDIMFRVYDGCPALNHVALDAGGNGQYLAEVSRQHLGAHRVSEIKLSIEWYRRLMPRLKAALEDDSLPLPMDDEIRTDYGLLRMIDGVARIPPTRTGEAGARRHGDAVVAGALAVYADEQDGGPTDAGRSVEDLAETGPGIDRDRDAPLDDYRGSLGGSLDDYRRM